ncbi:uncharacterized protein [Manis javanica]|uniref:uncharacterized protein isoform X10 n=1 Tax=Manis javanica TaxID=9974 RepID=UPI003C6D7D7F
MLTNLTASGKMESRPKKRRTACCRRRLRLHRLSLHRRCSRVHRRCPRQSSLKAFTRRKGTAYFTAHSTVYLHPRCLQMTQNVYA